MSFKLGKTQTTHKNSQQMAPADTLLRMDGNPTLKSIQGFAHGRA